MPIIEQYEREGHVVPLRAMSQARARRYHAQIVLKPGEFSLHHGRMFHVSNPNQSSGRRIGLAIRYISPKMSQIGGHTTMARLVRGEDRYGHFELAPAPEGVLEPEDVQRMLQAETVQSAYTFDGAEQTGKRRITQLLSRD